MRHSLPATAIGRSLVINDGVSGGVSGGLPEGAKPLLG